jgi:hypothetical protein
VSVFEIVLAIELILGPVVFGVVFWRRFDRLERRIDVLELRMVSEFAALRGEIRGEAFAKL